MKRRYRKTPCAGKSRTSQRSGKTNRPKVRRIRRQAVEHLRGIFAAGVMALSYSMNCGVLFVKVLGVICCVGLALFCFSAWNRRL